MVVLMSNDVFNTPDLIIHGLPHGAKVKVRLRPNDVAKVFVQRDGVTTLYVLERREGQVCLGGALAQNRRLTP